MYFECFYTPYNNIIVHILNNEDQLKEFMQYYRKPLDGSIYLEGANLIFR